MVKEDKYDMPIIYKDNTILKEAYSLTKDLQNPKVTLFWSDFFLSAIIGYFFLFVSMKNSNYYIESGSVCITIFSLYRAISFIHEIAHIKVGYLKGFKLAYNIFIGIPLLLPSFLYERVHSLHHMKTRYGTDKDPEYLPFARLKPWVLLSSIFLSLFAPLGLVFRFGILTPLSYLIPSLRQVVIVRFSALTINPQFRRQLLPKDMPKEWKLIEGAASLWSIIIIFSIIAGKISVHEIIIIYIAASGIAFVNHIRTISAHLWESDGSQLTVIDQYLDSVNFPRPAIFPALWAPVGLRYHALHHLLPSIPYHNLAEAHRRITLAMQPDSVYHKVNYTNWLRLVRGILSFHDRQDSI
ncbi:MULTISPECIES: fatty acid desaturase family protein [Acetobacter]|uniref:fatty acid desaturase family protein n=1 Tax=Acetobacter TaxID=434 RepID=UPI0037706048